MKVYLGVSFSIILWKKELLCWRVDQTNISVLFFTSNSNSLTNKRRRERLEALSFSVLQEFIYLKISLVQEIILNSFSTVL